MALDTTTLKNTLKTAFLANLPSPSSTQIDQVGTLSEAIANAMLVFVESTTITYTAGLIAPPGGGLVTGVFTNIIS